MATTIRLTNIKKLKEENYKIQMKSIGKSKWKVRWFLRIYDVNSTVTKPMTNESVGKEWFESVSIDKFEYHAWST